MKLFLTRIALLFAFVSLLACTKAVPPRAPVDPRNTDGPVNCAADESKANERCFAKAQDACDSLGCAEGCDIHRSRTSRWVTCAVDRRYSSMSSGPVARCEGYAGWSCPEGTECANEPGGCDREKVDDCVGICVPTTRP